MNKKSILKKTLLCFLFSIIISSVEHLCAQKVWDNHNLNEANLPSSPSFAEDIYIKDDPAQNQSVVSICSAFNGWLYGVYSHFDHNANQYAVTMLRSKDHGVNWDVLLQGPIGVYGLKILKLKILACGHDTTNLKVFIGWLTRDTTYFGKYVWVTRYNKNFIAEDEILHCNSMNVRDFAMASDDLNPAIGSNPFSLTVIYSTAAFLKDSIVISTSGNGGISMNSQHIASSSHYFNKVALAYGRSPTFSTGRYFAAWQEQENQNSLSGHVYTAHSEPNFNSSFSTPFMLDVIDTSTANKISNLALACQNNSAENDSSNISEVVLLEKYLTASQTYNLTGFHNKTAVTTTNFNNFNIGTTTDYIRQPDICFNAFDSTFIVTYFDSTTLKLLYYTHNFNMSNPDSWNLVSSGYNDLNNLVTPNPLVVMNFGTQTGMNAWVATRGTGNCAAMFDAPYIYYTGITENNPDRNDLKVKIFPNPASDCSTLEFELARIENAKIEICDQMGQSVLYFTYPNCTSGKHQVKIDLSKLAEGMYFLNVWAGDSLYSGKISKIR